VPPPQTVTNENSHRSRHHVHNGISSLYGPLTSSNGVCKNGKESIGGFDIKG